jgi:hypothetical protein
MCAKIVEKHSLGDKNMGKDQISFVALADLPSPELPTVFDATSGLDQVAIVECLHQRGFCILRGLFTNQLMDEVVERAELFLSKPAVMGAPGYWKKDYWKKLINPFVLGGPTLHLLLDEQVIDIVEKTMGSECILAETMLKFDRATSYVYFPMHADFTEGWRKSDKVNHELTKKDMQNVPGIGGAVLLHDTTEGAFTYCDTSHSLMAPKGQRLDEYTKSEQAIINARKVPCQGHRGDVVLFDDRGFHGPSQPSYKERTVILLDYYNVTMIGRLQASPMPIWSSDIAMMSSKQSRVAGVGSDFMVDPIEYTHTSFRNSFNYRVASYFLGKLFFLVHIKYIIRKWIGMPSRA